MGGGCAGLAEPWLNEGLSAGSARRRQGMRIATGRPGRLRSGPAPMAFVTDPMLSLALVMALCGLLPLGGALVAEWQRPAPPPVDAAAAIVAARAAGHGVITEMEWERGGWTLCASDAEGWPV